VGHRADGVRPTGEWENSTLGYPGIIPGGIEEEIKVEAFSIVDCTVAAEGYGDGESADSGVAAVCELASPGLSEPGIWSRADCWFCDKPGKTADGEPDGKTPPWGEVRIRPGFINEFETFGEECSDWSSSSSSLKWENYYPVFHRGKKLEKQTQFKVDSN